MFSLYPQQRVDGIALVGSNWVAGAWLVRAAQQILFQAGPSPESTKCKTRCGTKCSPEGAQAIQNVQTPAAGFNLRLCGFVGDYRTFTVELYLELPSKRPAIRGAGNTWASW